MSFEFIWFVIQAAIGVGLLIFVHELGHFLVAKMCGVKCEKFMIGFDIGGYKLSRQWGETVYGIGILPLGGYVKMLGQEDNPANIAEQLEQSRVAGEDFDGVEVTGPGGEKYLVDRRSYMAKSVTQRMAIISAGVVMNVIFAVVFATIAFGLGVPEKPCVVSKTVPGSAAWQAGLQTGDEILKIDDIEKPSFEQLAGEVTLADLEQGVPLVVRRGDTGEETDMTLKPRKQNGHGLAKIGIISSQTLKLYEKDPVLRGSMADISEGFRGGDEIVAVDGQKVSDFRELAALLVRRVDQPLGFTVNRRMPLDPDDSDGMHKGSTTKSITVPPNPLKRFGLVMKMGPIVALQNDAPADEAGLESGRVITRVTTPEETYSPDAGDEPLDPITLPGRLQRLAAGESVAITTRSADDPESAQATAHMSVREVDWLEDVTTTGSPVSIPELGLAYDVLNDVVAVVPDSPAARAGLQAGDQLRAATLLVPKPKSEKFTKIEIPLGDDLNWPIIIANLQDQPAETKMEIEFERNGKEESVTMLPAADVQNPTYVAERGLILEPLERVVKAESFGEQLEYGWNATTEAMLMVYRFLQKLWEGQVPATALLGPFSIAKVAYAQASRGASELLMFMTILSANLAVVNFLPIPVLDGGHMVFLAYEGIFRRPPNERIVVALHLLGLALILSLLVFLLALDFGLIQRNL